MNLEIKVVKSNDLNIVSSLVEIERGAFEQNGLTEWEIVPFIRHGLVIALTLNGKVIGGAQFLRDWNNPEQAYLFGIAVDTAYRGKGFGTRFLSECCKTIKEEGFKSVELTVDASNHPAVRVYKEKLGFNTIETRIAEYGGGEDRLVMVKAL